MFAKLINLLPRDLLVYLYKITPFQGLKDWIAYRAQHKFLVGVLGVFTNETGQILLLHHDYRSEPWGVPGGWMEMEAPEDGLLRELMEETGFEAEIIDLAQIIHDPRPNRIEIVFRARIIGGSFRPSSEISDFQYCELGIWPEGMPSVQKNLIMKVMEQRRDL